MKKFFLFFLCLTLTVAVILPTVVFADSNPANGAAEDIIYFLNPTAITAVDDYLFVADKIEDGRSAVHYFNLSSGTPILVDTLELGYDATNLLANNDTLYVVTNKQVLTAKITASKLQLTDTVFQISNDNSDIVDFAIYNGKEVILTSEGLYYEGGYLEYLHDTIACVTSGNYVYYVYNNGSYTDDKSPIARRTGSILNQAPSDVFNSNLNWRLNLRAKGLFAWNNNEIAIFSEHKIYYSIEAGSQYTLDMLDEFDEYVILDADMSNDKLYVLNDNHQIVIYKIDTELEEIAVIGDDTVQLEVPEASNYTSFTLVRAKGYPANIVFKTTGENSLDNIETEATEYIVIGYDGEEASHFYYVFVRDGRGNYKFGWVKKSDNAENVNKDDKLEVINTSWSSDGNLQYRTVFTTLYAVYIYELPCGQANSHPFTQTASNRTEVTILQEFEEKSGDKTVNWLYVSYNDGTTEQKGFVKQEDIGNIYPHVENTTVIAYRKINSTLFSSVRVYMFGDPAKMTDEYLAKYTVTKKDENGESVVVEETVPPLYSGHRVSVISEENGIALVQIQRGDGAIAYGYVYSNQLIDAHGITTNAIVGLTLLAIAIVLVVVLVAVYLQRKKTKTSKKNTNKENA